ncbi:MAG: hypothetical protein ACYDCO_11735 [Armatimonadota bacterium]
MPKFPQHHRLPAGAGLRSVLLLILALAAVWLAGCRQQPAPPAQGWVRLQALLPLHPNQAMLTDIDRRLDALAAQRRQILEHPEAPLPPEYIALDLPAVDPLPAAQPTAAPPRPAVPAEPRLAEMRARLTEAMSRRYARLKQELADERDAAYAEKERELRRQADVRREDAAKEYALRIPPAKIRLRLANEAAARARGDADAAQAQAATARERADTVARAYAKDDLRHRKEIRKAEENANYYENRARSLADYAAEKQAAADDIARRIDKDSRELAAAQAKIGEEMTAELAAFKNEQAKDMQARLASWKAREEHAIDLKIAERAAQLTAENDRPAAAPPPAVNFPALPPRPITTNSGRMRGEVNAAGFNAYKRRLAAVNAIDDTVDKLTTQRRELCKTIEQDTREAILALAAQHHYTVQFDKPAGQELTPAMRRWLTEYWPEENGE